MLEGLKLNGVSIHALLDTGCTNTSMSPNTMTKCKLTHMLSKFKHQGPSVKAIGGSMMSIGTLNLVPATCNKYKFVFPC